MKAYQHHSSQNADRVSRNVRKYCNPQSQSTVIELQAIPLHINFSEEQVHPTRSSQATGNPRHGVVLPTKTSEQGRRV
jgi:hypothetical protein